MTLLFIFSSEQNDGNLSWHEFTDVIPHFSFEKLGFQYAGCWFIVAVETMLVGCWWEYGLSSPATQTNYNLRSLLGCMHLARPCCFFSLHQTKIPKPIRGQKSRKEVHWTFDSKSSMDLDVLCIHFSASYMYYLIHVLRSRSAIRLIPFSCSCLCLLQWPCREEELGARKLLASLGARVCVATGESLLLSWIKAW